MCVGRVDNSFIEDVSNIAERLIEDAVFELEYIRTPKSAAIAAYNMFVDNVRYGTFDTRPEFVEWVQQHKSKVRQLFEGVANDFIFEDDYDVDYIDDSEW